MYYNCHNNVINGGHNVYKVGSSVTESEMAAVEGVPDCLHTMCSKMRCWQGCSQGQEFTCHDSEGLATNLQGQGQSHK